MSEKNSIPAISIRQPWAELILCNKKKIEVRSWETTYRGKLYLHTGKVPDGNKALDLGMPNLFRGGYVGVIELAAVIPFTSDSWEKWREQHRSDNPFRPGHYAWMIRNPRRFVHPIPAPGDRGLYYPDPIILKVLEETPFVKTVEEEKSSE
jgi:hypothetical protein